MNRGFQKIPHKLAQKLHSFSVSDDCNRLSSVSPYPPRLRFLIFPEKGELFGCKVNAEKNETVSLLINSERKSTVISIPKKAKAAWSDERFYFDKSLNRFPKIVTKHILHVIPNNNILSEIFFALLDIVFHFPTTSYHFR